jgi:geranylgeranyl pyrophosphate synthase
MTWLPSIQLKVKEYLLNQLPGYWPEIPAIAQPVIDDAVSPEVIIPVSCCKAVGGDPEKTIEMAAGLMSVLMSVRILDDLQDRDKVNGLYRTVGSARAFNYSFAFMTLAYKIFNAMDCDESIKRNILATFDEDSLVTLAGQDRDLQGINRTWEDYWKTAEMKTCYITSSGAAMGAMLGTQNTELIQACRLYGYHWGLTLQILNDMEGIWEPDGETDLQKGKVTLPVLYGINCQHPERRELETIVWQNKIAENAERVKEILDHIDTKSYLIWAALEQRKNALDAIQVCPDDEGKNALTCFLNGVFGDIDELLNRNENHIKASFLSTPVQPKSPGAFAAKKIGGAYRSIALGIRSTNRSNYN